MEAEVGTERFWLRPLGLFLVATLFAVGQPGVVMVLTAALLTLLTRPLPWVPGGVALVALLLVFAGSASGDGLWFLERGWGVLVAGGFVVATLVVPGRGFLDRGLFALAVAAGAGSLLLQGWGGSETVDALVALRIQEGMRATLSLMGPMMGNGSEPVLAETIRRTAEVQRVLYPALLSLSSLASLGVGWWLYERWIGGRPDGLGPLVGFRFADGVIWILIAGLLLGLLAGLETGWGRMGANLLAFTSVLYMVRGIAVLFAITGGVTIARGLVMVLGVILAAPLVLTGALVVGVGDTWLDIRARWYGRGESVG